MTTMASQITSLTVVYSIVYSDADQRKHQSSASLAFVRGIHRGPVNSPHKWPVTRKIFSFDDVIMCCECFQGIRMANPRAEAHQNRKASHTPSTDRGYAWLVLLGCFMIDLINSSSFMVGLFLVEFQHHFGVSATRVSWIGALQHSVGTIAGKPSLVYQNKVIL